MMRIALVRQRVVGRLSMCLSDSLGELCEGKVVAAMTMCH